MKTRKVIRINELKLRPDHSMRELEQEIRKELKLKNQSFQYEIMRRSIDARKKPDLRYVYTIDVEINDPQTILRRLKSKKIILTEKTRYFFQYKSESGADASLPPVIVGSGPAGLFCALMLARAGRKPILIERGAPVEDRVKDVEAFWETGILNSASNVQFGEGGAGTFSDGKLNTLIKDPEGKIRFILNEFVKAGADESILYDHKPHIGTDVLVEVVHHIREEIRALGGEVRFRSCLTGWEKAGEDGTEYLLELNHGESCLRTGQVVLAIGHSARDTFEMLHRTGIPMQAKSFAVGLRMEHPQRLINDAMYGEDCPYELGAAPYKVTHKCEDGRGVYSFCMCPGGYVVNASSEPGRLAVNGMSYSGRNSQNANSAIVVTVNPMDYGAEDALSGIRFQRELEEKAFRAGEGKIPVQRLEDFRNERRDPDEKESGYYCSMSPEMKGNYRYADVRSILPEHLNLAILEGITSFGKRIRGFDHGAALLSGVESRTSSPVRIPRNEKLQIDAFPGIYPCGEGAGYAGGITSAAADGIRIAEAVCRDASMVWGPEISRI